MARMLKNRRCMVCGEGPVQMWTIDNMFNVAVTYLCRTHGAPLQEIMNEAGGVAPDDQVPIPERGTDTADSLRRGRREQRMVPLLDWTPPDLPS